MSLREKMGRIVDPDAWQKSDDASLRERRAAALDKVDQLLDVLRGPDERDRRAGDFRFLGAGWDAFKAERDGAARHEPERNGSAVGLMRAAWRGMIDAIKGEERDDEVGWDDVDG